MTDEFKAQQSGQVQKDPQPAYRKGAIEAFFDYLYDHPEMHVPPPKKRMPFKEGAKWS